MFRQGPRNKNKNRSHTFLGGGARGVYRAHRLWGLSGENRLVIVDISEGMTAASNSSDSTTPRSTTSVDTGDPWGLSGTTGS